MQESDADAVTALVTETGFFSESEQQTAVALVEEALSMGKASGYGYGYGYEFVFADMVDMSGGLQGYTCYGPVPDTVSSLTFIGSPCLLRNNGPA